MKQYDTFIIGHLSIDEIVEMDGTEEILMGGAIVHAAYTAVMTGNRTGICIKTGKKEKAVAYLLPVPHDDIYWRESGAGTTSIRNVYLDENHERRTTKALVHADGITAREIPADIDTKVFHMAGLIRGDFEDEMIRALSLRSKVALDVQGILRAADMTSGAMEYHDWEAKKEYLPYVTYLKTDAAEAEILTGFTDRRQAAKQMRDWGAKEVMITHHDEVLVYDGETFYTCPLKPRSLAGRTGRGDTTFSAYITERQRADIQASLDFAAQLVSLKMETPGPFKGSRAQVLAFAKTCY